VSSAVGLDRDGNQPRRTLRSKKIVSEQHTMTPHELFFDARSCQRASADHQGSSYYWPVFLGSPPGGKYDLNTKL
jgi:hypothetical protein